MRATIVNFIELHSLVAEIKHAYSYRDTTSIVRSI
jgi:hypothetical protein